MGCISSEEGRLIATSPCRLFLTTFTTEFPLRNVIWLADTNYRIDLENETVRSLALNNDFDSLVAADQVCMFYSVRGFRI